MLNKNSCLCQDHLNHKQTCNLECSPLQQKMWGACLRLLHVFSGDTKLASVTRSPDWQPNVVPCCKLQGRLPGMEDTCPSFYNCSWGYSQTISISFYCCAKTLSQTWLLKATHIYFLIVSVDQESEYSLAESCAKLQSRCWSECSLIWDSIEERSASKFAQVVGKIHFLVGTEDFLCFVVLFCFVFGWVLSATRDHPHFLSTLGFPTWPLAFSKQPKESKRLHQDEWVLESYGT